MFAAGNPVSSGLSYQMVQVGDRTPTSLADFVGHVAVVIDCGGRQQVLTGVGDSRGEFVRFHQKDAATGKDVRVWRIGSVAGSGFAVEATAAGQG